jgi:predicted unusual protein kinase regulating ubiquinone biosynthesis (AarF/ABC1/UbiB family)
VGHRGAVSEPLRQRHADRRAAAPAPVRIDFRRYRKVRRFVTRAFLHALWWDVLLALPGISRFRRPAAARYARIAQRYRALAVEMGGVLIKLGQFLSIRVDLLPPEVIHELSGLQDEVPPEPLADIVREIEDDLGHPLAAVFAWISPTPAGAASLAQVHRARLLTGEEVVVKVLRPGIDVLVETDLAATALALRLLRTWRRLRRRVDFDRFAEELRRTTLRELDLTAEGHHAERFARDFAGDARILIPRIYWQQSARRTLTMEDVGFIKIADLDGLAAAGIDRAEVASALYRTYLRQIFIHHFVHADPHPGNLFIRPLPAAGEAQISPGQTVGPPPAGGQRQFQIAFVDFGMTAEVPEHLQAALREYVIGLGTRDAARVIRSYVAAGVLLPGADLRRLEEVHEELFERFWGVSIGNLREVAMSQARYFFSQYRDLLYSAPFQIQVDLLFVGRAMGLLAGMGTHLAPEFDPWAETLPFAEALAAEELQGGWRAAAAEVLAQGRVLLGLPRRLEALAARALRGQLPVQTTPSPDAKRLQERLERAVRRLGWMVAAAGLAISGSLLRAAAPDDRLATALLIGAGLLFLAGLLSR